MARYVLISFEDNADADLFIQDILENRVGFYHNGEFHSYEEAKLWGMYFKPTQFCECTSRGNQQSRGQKYGLWIDVCGKPIRGHTQHPKNLLIPDEVRKKLEPLDRISHSIGVREGVEYQHIPIAVRVR